MKIRFLASALLACVLVGGALAQRGPSGPSYGSLLGRPDVRKELGITLHQLNLLGVVTKRKRDDRKGTPEQMAAEDEKKQLGVLTAAQQKRAKELLIQRFGNGIVVRSDIQAELKFSAAQKTKVASLVKKQREAMEKLRESGGDRAAMRAAAEKNQKAMDAELAKVITAAQKAQLKKMSGKPFKFEEGRR